MLSRSNMQGLLVLTLFYAVQFVYSGDYHSYYRQRVFKRMLLGEKVRQCRAKTLGIGSDVGIGSEPLNIPLYTRTFNFIMDGKFESLEQVLEQDVDRFKAHQACLGRKSDDAVIQEGQRALQFFADNFGVDIRGDVPPEDLVDLNVVVELPGGRVRLQTYILNKSGRYRVFSETKGLRCRVYEDNLLAHGGWVIEFLDDMILNGGSFQGLVAAGDTIYFGDHQFFTDLDGPKRPVMIHFESTEPMRLRGGHYLFLEHRITNPDYGVGVELLLFDIVTDNQTVNGRSTLTFPGQV